jgi:hypothetical protein
MNYEFRPVASDGNFTIGYDADGLAGIVPGHMVESFDNSSDFVSVTECYEFCGYVAQTELDSFGNEVLFWNEMK